MPEFNTDHIQIFKDLLAEFGYQQLDVARFAQWDKSKVNRFLKGKDVKAGEFFYLLKCMPNPFETRFWHLYQGETIDWEKMISAIDSEEAKRILLAMADRLQMINLPRALSHE